jgi:hypothetical protein
MRTYADALHIHAGRNWRRWREWGSRVAQPEHEQRTCTCHHPSARPRGRRGGDRVVQATAVGRACTSWCRPHCPAGGTLDAPVATVRPLRPCMTLHGMRALARTSGHACRGGAGGETRRPREDFDRFQQAFCDAIGEAPPTLPAPQPDASALQSHILRLPAQSLEAARGLRRQEGGVDGDAGDDDSPVRPVAAAAGGPDCVPPPRRERPKARGKSTPRRVLVAKVSAAPSDPPVPRTASRSLEHWGGGAARGSPASGGSAGGSVSCAPHGAMLLTLRVIRVDTLHEQLGVSAIPEHDPDRPGQRGLWSRAAAVEQVRGQGQHTPFAWFHARNCTGMHMRLV